MKKEATHYFKNLIENLGYSPKSISLSKIKQSNKKSAYITHFELDKCSMSGFIFQNQDNDWIFNLNNSTTEISKSEFDQKVKESEHLKRKLANYLEKQAKINLSESDIRKKDIQIKEERKFKNI